MTVLGNEVQKTVLGNTAIGRVVEAKIARDPEKGEGVEPAVGAKRVAAVAERAAVLAGIPIRVAADVSSVGLAAVPTFRICSRKVRKFSFRLPRRRSVPRAPV
jgi:hypothetical protein